MKSNSRAGKASAGEGGAELHVVGLAAFALQDEVGLADGVGLGVHFLAVQVDRRLLALLPGQLRQRLLRDRQHPAGSTGAVIDQVGAGPHHIGNRQEDEAGHELHHIPRSEVFTGLLVVLLVEAPDELFEDGAHTVVVEAVQTHGAVSVQNGPGAEVDRHVEELLQQEPQRMRLDQPGNLVAELELLQDLLDVGREAVEVRLEVGPEPLLLADRGQVTEPEGGRVVEGLAGCLTQGLSWLVIPAASICSFMRSTASFVGSRTASRRRMTVMGRMTSRYLPRT